MVQRNSKKFTKLCSSYNAEKHEANLPYTGPTAMLDKIQNDWLNLFSFHINTDYSEGIWRLFIRISLCQIVNPRSINILNSLHSVKIDKCDASVLNYTFLYSESVI